MINTRKSHARNAFFITQFLFLLFTIFALVEIAEKLCWRYMAGAAAVFFIFFILIIFLFKKTRQKNAAFYIPFIIYIFHNGLSLLTGNYNDFFVFCIGITCVGALYFNSKALLKYIIFSNLITATHLILGVYFPDIFTITNTGMSLNIILLDWFIAFCSSIIIYLITSYAEDRKNNAKTAQESFVGFLTSSPDPVVLMDAQKRVVYISNSFMNLTEIKNSFHAKDRSIFDLIKNQELKNTFYEILSEGGSCQITREIILNGKQFFFEIVAVELQNDIVGHLIYIIDITVAMKAKFEAEAASRSKSAFLATMSHEIRTPLSAIIGLSEIEMQKQVGKNARNDLEKIHDAGVVLLGIINNILDISKIESGNFNLVPAEYYFPSMINDTVQLNKVRIGIKNIVFKLEINETIPVKLFGDELRVKQILNNLLSNAIKYTDEGSIVLSVDWEKRDGEAWVTFKVSDTGYGIKENDIPKLFSEYRQLDEKASRSTEGTGLGLSITKNLVELMNGKISVESKYGKGSTFIVQIKQFIYDADPIGKNIVKELENFQYREIRRRKEHDFKRNYMPYGKVLVVDDVKTNIDVVKGFMHPYGVKIETASSGSEAIEKIRKAADNIDEAPYDVIFMDHMMPGMDGIETVKVIRNESQSDYCCSVPIIALSANVLFGNKEMFLMNGFDDFIAKPIDIIKLDNILNNYIRNKQKPETLMQAELDSAHLEHDKDDKGIINDVFIEGLDLRQGRESYTNEAAYLEILRLWCLQTPELLEKIKSPARENLHEYGIIVHGLKGSSYGIYAHNVGHEAEKLEHYAKAGDLSSVLAGNPGFIEKVNKLNNEITELLKLSQANKEKKEIINAPDPVLLNELLEASKRYKSTKIDEIMGKLEKYDYETGGELISWLRNQIDNLEYDIINKRLSLPNPLDDRWEQ